jgi:hypothetical protein
MDIENIFSVIIDDMVLGLCNFLDDFEIKWYIFRRQHGSSPV